MSAYGSLTNNWRCYIMGLPDISITTYVYLLSKAIPSGLILFLTVIATFLFIFLVILYKRKKFTFSPYFALVPVAIILVLAFFSVQSVANFTVELKEIWSEEKVTEVLTVQSISKQTPVIKNEEIATEKGNLLNVRNEWYFKEGKKYEIIYYKTSKVIADVNKIEGENYK